jgi:hypothetical protein
MLSKAKAKDKESLGGNARGRALLHLFEAI